LKKDLSQQPDLYSPVTVNDIDMFDYNVNSSIIGLMCLHKCLEFFGCLKCENMVASRENIPAKRVAGDDDEDDLLTSLEVYLDKPLFIIDILNHLFELFRDGEISNWMYGGSLIMNCMRKYLDNSRIQVSGSASLFYVLKQSKEANRSLSYFYLKRLIETVINAMEEHIDESPVSD
jgi:Zyg-11 family protein